MGTATDKIQQSFCARFGVGPVPSPDHLKVGVARNVKDGIQPINGMRIAPEGDTTGWYIWAGEECSEAPDFFVPLHVKHLTTWCPQVIPYLQLPPGWRFLIAPNYEDVWKDDSLTKKQ
jgi:hypothetical protein